MDFDRLTKNVVLHGKRLCVQNWCSKIKYLWNNIDLNKDVNIIDVNTEECFNTTKDKLNQKVEIRLTSEAKTKNIA